MSLVLVATVDFDVDCWCGDYVRIHRGPMKETYRHVSLC